MISRQEIELAFFNAKPPIALVKIRKCLAKGGFYVYPYERGRCWIHDKNGLDRVIAELTFKQTYGEKCENT
jgi:hypothetical protein